MRSVSDLGLPANLRGAAKANHRLWPTTHSSLGGRCVPREESGIQSGDGWRRPMSTRKRNGALLHAPIQQRNHNNSEADLVFWRYAPGVCRFQTSRPDIARKLSQRSGARLVAWSVNGGYLRVFQESIEAWRAQRLVTRYLKATNGVFPRRIPAASASEQAGSITTAARVL